MRPPLICFTGIDGCGKSTQVDLLSERLRAEGLALATVWTGGKPYISQPLIWLAKRRLRAPQVATPTGDAGAARTGKGEADYANYLASSARLFRKSRLLRWGWTLISLLEHAIEADTKILPHLARGRMVISDRYLFKSVVNLAVLLDLDPDDLPRLLRHPALRLAPRPDLYFLLDLPAEVGFARKPEHPSIEYARRRVPIYRALAQFAGMYAIDGTQEPHVIHEQIYAAVSPLLAAWRPRVAA